MKLRAQDPVRVHTNALTRIWQRIMGKLTFIAVESKENSTSVNTAYIYSLSVIITLESTCVCNGLVSSLYAIPLTLWRLTTYMSRTAPLTSKRCILYIYSTNVGTEYFKHAVYSPLFSLQNAVCFIMLTCLVPVLFTFYTQGVLKLKKNNSGPKGLLMCILHSVHVFRKIIRIICNYFPKQQQLIGPSNGGSILVEWIPTLIDIRMLGLYF